MQSAAIKRATLSDSIPAFRSAQVHAIDISGRKRTLTAGIDRDVTVTERSAVKLFLNETIRLASAFQPSGEPFHFQRQTNRIHGIHQPLGAGNGGIWLIASSGIIAPLKAYRSSGHAVRRRVVFCGGTFNSVKITFDPAKRQAALDHRGLNFADASIVFAGATITVQDMRRDMARRVSRPLDFSPIEW